MESKELSLRFYNKPSVICFFLHPSLQVATIVHHGRWFGSPSDVR